MRDEELRALLHNIVEGILPVLTDRTAKARTESYRQELLDVSAQILSGVTAATGNVKPIGEERTVELMACVVNYAEWLIAAVDEAVCIRNEDQEPETNPDWLRDGDLPPGAKATE